MKIKSQSAENQNILNLISLISYAVSVFGIAKKIYIKGRMVQKKAKQAGSKRFSLLHLHFCYCSGVPEPTPAKQPEQDDESRSAAGKGRRSDTNRTKIKS